MFALIIAIIVVHAFYVSVIRPNAAQIIEEQNAAALGRFFYANLEVTPQGTADWRFSKPAILKALRAGMGAERALRWLESAEAPRWLRALPLVPFAISAAAIAIAAFIVGVLILMFFAVRGPS